MRWSGGGGIFAPPDPFFLLREGDVVVHRLLVTRRVRATGRKKELFRRPVSKDSVDA